MDNVLKNFNVAECCGCFSCVIACPCNALSKTKDKYGFMIPQLDNSKCINCGKCLEACPYKSNHIKYHTPITTFAGINNNDDAVLKSSSGGIFSAIANEVLSRGGVVFGATMDDSFIVYHKMIINSNQLDELRKSKYIQSDLRDTFKEVKKNLIDGIDVLFVGTPCQTTALYAYLGGDRSNLTMVDIVCHGVPNNDFFIDYIKNMERKSGFIRKYEFRKKRKKNNGMNWYFSFTTKNEHVRNWPEDSFNYLYMTRCIYRDSCYECRFAKKERVSDITLCDYWNWEKKHKNDFEEYSTISGIVANSEKGLDIINRIKQRLTIVESSYDFLSKNNSSLIDGGGKNTVRDEILNDWLIHGYNYVDKEFKRKHKMQRIKYRILMHLPESVKHIRRG